MTNKIKVFEVSKYCGGNYSSWIPNSVRVDSMDGADLVLFKGGADVDPSYYGESKHPLTQCNPERDAYEKQIYDAAKAMGKKMLGICRGSQFLSTMNGAKLHQHIEGHGGPHMCYTIDADGNEGEIPSITSTHHQCLDLDSVKDREDFQLLGFGFDNHHTLIPEFYTFPDCLCIQSHPEFISGPEGTSKGYEEYIAYCLTLLNNLLND